MAVLRLYDRLQDDSKKSGALACPTLPYQNRLMSKRQKLTVVRRPNTQASLVLTKMGAPALVVPF